MTSTNTLTGHIYTVWPKNWVPNWPQKINCHRSLPHRIDVITYTTFNKEVETIPVISIPFSSVQFSRSVVSDSLQPNELQHARPPCLSPNSNTITQTHVHRAGDAIQPSHPLLSPSPPALNLSQDQGLFQWVSSLHRVAKVLESEFQHQSF